MESKICQSCGRPMENRKRWRDNFEQVKYCSKTCKKNKTPLIYMSRILELLDDRACGHSICPSEVLPASEKQNKLLMERVRSAGRLLAAQGKIDILQKGKVVVEFKGPIRFRKKIK